MVRNQINKSFFDSLQKGLGRAVDYIIQNDKKELRCDLLNACIHNLVYDSQSEASRADWLFELINLTDDVEFYRQHIFQALPNTNDFWDAQQLYELVAIWAKQGNVEAKQIIYETFRKQEFSESWLGGEQIVAIDGIAGLLTVAEIVGRRLLQDEELWEDDTLICQAGETFGSFRVMKALERKSQTNINVGAYLKAVESYQNNTDTRKNLRKESRKQILNFDTVIQYIEKAKNSFYLLARFGKYAEDIEIEQIFERLLIETREKQLIRYLWIFKNRKLPRLDSRLIDLVQTDNTKLQSAAIAALSQYEDNSLRDLALRLIKQQPISVHNRIIKLLTDNYQSGDVKVIESALNISQDIDFRHSIGMDLIELVDAQKDPELKACSIWVYENTPCSYCRQQIVEILVKLQQAPRSMLRECLYDCSPEIRSLVQKEVTEY